MFVVELSDNSFKRVSFMNNEIIRLPDCVVQCSEASTLLLQGNHLLLSIPERFLQGFEALRVLNMSNTSIRSMPPSLLQLGELRALLLGGCRYLKELPPLEGLTKLRVLDLSTTSIGELPRGVENLSNLKQLNLSFTHTLKYIQAGIIPRLSSLEVLDMEGSDYFFSVKRDVQEEMAYFEELKCLERLLVLNIVFERIPYFSSEDLSWINKLRQFYFLVNPKDELINKSRQFYFSVNPKYEFVEVRHKKRAVSIRNLDLRSGERIGPLLSEASSLHLHNCLGLSDMLEDLVINSVRSFAGLKSLTIQSCSGSVWQGGCAAHYDLLPNLEELNLRELNYGKSISELLGHFGLRFPKLKSLQVNSCSKMEYLIYYGDFIHALPNLEGIMVRSCNELGELFSYHSMQNITPDPVVPNLRRLELTNLPKLRTLCRDEETWPLLEKVYVFRCDLVTKLPLADKNAENIKEIEGELEWWDDLEWHADTTKSSLLPYFHPIWVCN